MSENIAKAATLAGGRRGKGMSEQVPGANGSVGRKLAVLALAVAAIGLPINDLTDYWVLVAAGVVIFTGTIKPLPSRWVAAVLLAAAVVGVHLAFPAPRIDEGHNVFLPGPGATKPSVLPRDVFDFLDRQFAEQLIAQSIAWEQSDEARRTVTASHERTVLEAGGVVIRYGQVWGPGTYYETTPPARPRIHLDDAARLSVLALEAPPGVTLIIDDRALRA